MKSVFYHFLFSILFISGCNTNNNSENTSSIEVTSDAPSNLPDPFSKGLSTHGGIDRWRSFQTVSYELVTPSMKQGQLIDLHTRKVLISDSLYSLGFDGKQVWVSPGLAAFGDGSPRFYHNLYFYFFAMPYVLADPGIQYEDLGIQTINEKSYNAIKVSYDQGIGDSPEDFYVAHFDLETGLMEVLLYTVTYFSKESHEKYNALVYEWQEVEGLQVTKSFKGYKYDSNRLGELRYEASFHNVQFSKEKPLDSLFSIPDIAEVDSL